MQTKTLRLFTRAVTVLSITVMAARPSYGQERKMVNLSSAGGLPFSDGIVAGSTHIAGQGGTDDSDKLAAGGIGPETTAALTNNARLEISAIAVKRK
jgi:hypothetical protein